MENVIILTDTLELSSENICCTMEKENGMVRFCLICAEFGNKRIYIPRALIL